MVDIKNVHSVENHRVLERMNILNLVVFKSMFITTFSF